MWVTLVAKGSQRKQNIFLAAAVLDLSSTLRKRWARRNLKEKLGRVNMYS